MDSIFAKWGYHAISIDYENNVIAVASAHSLDPTAFDHYRNAIITGAPVSDKVKVDAANSILNRFQKLLVYLVEHVRAGGWDEFVTNGMHRCGIESLLPDILKAPVMPHTSAKCSMWNGC